MTTPQQKVNHYILNLQVWAVISKEKQELLEKVMEVKDQVSFILFCEDRFDRQKFSTDYLEEYFIINK